jgi:hypothetical protein
MISFVESMAGRCSLPPERVRILDDASGLSLESLDRAVITAPVLWSGPSLFVLQRLCEVLSEPEFESLTLFVVDGESINSLDASHPLVGATRVGGVSGWGETFWIHQGSIQHFSSLGPDFEKTVRLYTRDLLGSADHT